MKLKKKAKQNKSVQVVNKSERVDISFQQDKTFQISREEFRRILNFYEWN